MSTESASLPAALSGSCWGARVRAAASRSQGLGAAIRADYCRVQRVSNSYWVALDIEAEASLGGAVPHIGQRSVRVARHEGFRFPRFEHKDMAGNGPDICPVSVNTDRWPVVESVFDLMDVADPGRNRGHLSRLEMNDLLRLKPARSTRGIVSRDFRAPQHADQTPNRVIVNRGALARPPNKTHDRKPLQRIAVEEVLAILRRIRRGEFGGKPVVDRHQFVQGCGGTVEHFRFAGAGVG